MPERQKYSNENFNQNGVNHKTHSFIADAISSGTHKELIVEQRNLLGMYFATDASFSDLADIYQPHLGDLKKYKIVNRIRTVTRQGLEALWENLPDHLKSKHRKKEVILMKGQTFYKEVGDERISSMFDKGEKSEDRSAVHVRESDVEELDLGVIRVREMLSNPDIKNLSVAVVRLDGKNKETVNRTSDSVYYVMEGMGIFTIKNREIEVRKGDIVFIPKGIAYFDVGNMTLLAINSPKFDRDQIEIIE